jgi:dTDP-4-dehydrorhamnose 3,5-epimerase
MKKIETKIPGCYIIEPKHFSDHRGDFVKVFQNEMFEEMGLKSCFKEEYYSISKKGVLRGLHFQVPPYDHVKCIGCLQGEIFDAVVDLRKNSSTYGQHVTFHLMGTEPKIIYIPEGLAHGFVALSMNALFLNKTTTVFHGDSDKGIRWDSCGIEWPEMIFSLSEKDEHLPTFDEFESPF